jgi:hypothetical protein
VSVLRLILLAPAAALLLFGAEGLYYAVRARHETVLSCDQFARSGAASPRVRVTGCAFDHNGAAHRRAGERIDELFLPARSSGDKGGAAHLIVATRDPSALALAQTVFGAGRTATPEQSLAVMQKVVAVLGISNAIDGLARTGTIERLRSKRILSGFATPVAADAAIVDVRGAPDYLRPALALAAGILLVLPWLLSRGTRSAPAAKVEAPPRVAEELEPLHAYAHDEYFPVSTPTDHDGQPQTPETTERPITVALPALLLLNLDVSAGPDAIESAPPLGKRPDVVAILAGVIPDLHVDGSERRLARTDGSVKFDLGSGDTIATAVVEARGEAGVALVKEILLMTGWRAFAPKTGLFVSVEDLEALAALAGGESGRSPLDA